MTSFEYNNKITTAPCDKPGAVVWGIQSDQVAWNKGITFGINDIAMLVMPKTVSFLMYKGHGTDHTLLSFL